MSAKSRILAVVEEHATYPLDQAELIGVVEVAVERGDLDADDLVVAQALHDSRFVTSDELAHRLDEALGMPAADPDVSALAADTDWRER